VVMEVGTHSAWARDVVARNGHEVLVANPRQMEGPKQRKRKNDRVDAHKLARDGQGASARYRRGSHRTANGQLTASPETPSAVSPRRSAHRVRSRLRAN
jgi:transposase